jgi:putative sigma-54 modulation protein
MNIQITSRKFKASDSLKSFIREEIKGLEKYEDAIQDAEVILSYIHPKDSIKQAEIILNVPSKVLKATEETDDFKKSVSAAVDKLKRQLKKYKTQKIKR